MTESLENYTRTFSTFGGADMVGTVNGKPCGEIQDITYVERLVQPRMSDEDGNLVPPITGKIHIISFGGKEPSIRAAIQGKDDTLVLFFADETGNKMSIDFEGFQAVKRTGGFSVDDVLFHEDYHFTAWHIRISDRDWHMKDNGDIVFGTYTKPVMYEKADEVRYAEPEEVIGG